MRKSSKTQPMAKTRAVIPDEMLIEIMARLPARSVGRFRSVSKSFLSVISSPSFVKAHTQKSRADRRSFIAKQPDCLEHIFGKELFSSSLNARISLSIVPSLNFLPDNFIEASCDGHVLLYNKNIRLYNIVNPLTGQSIILSKSAGYCPVFLGLYFHRSSSKYRILRASIHEKTYVMVVGESSWRMISSCRPTILHFNQSVDVNGSLHWLAWRDVLKYMHGYDADNNVPPEFIMTFDKETEVYSQFEMPPSEKLRGTGGSLVDLSGELGLWIAGDNGIMDVWIMKKCWVRRYSINCAGVKGCPGNLNFRSRVDWLVGMVVFVGGEDLLVFTGQKYLIRWNLKSGACEMRYFYKYLQLVPYIETLFFLDQFSFSYI